MNNKPVAWMMVERENGNAYFKMAEPTRDEKVSHHSYPLYTHPVKELTLTDEKILEVANNKGWRGDLRFLIEFAKAILRKASEK